VKSLTRWEHFWIGPGGSLRRKWWLWHKLHSWNYVRRFFP